MKTLKRRASSGFVKFPTEFSKRTVDGCARFRTRCDMLVGPCACGHVHQESDDWVQDLLERNGVEIDSLELSPTDGIVYMPRYWNKSNGHRECTVLSGRCACGKIHTANERWVVNLLSEHNARIINCAEVVCLSLILKTTLATVFWIGMTTIALGVRFNALARVYE